VEIAPIRLVMDNFTTTAGIGLERILNQIAEHLGQLGFVC
jgi:hypothetical protein